MESEPKCQRGRPIPKRGCPGPDGKAPSTRFRKGNTAALKHGAYWILRQEPDIPLPANMPADLRERIQTARNGLEMAFHALPHGRFPMGTLLVGNLSRHVAALMCLDAAVAEKGIIREDGEGLTWTAVQWLNLAERVTRMLSRWGMDPASIASVPGGSGFHLTSWRSQWPFEEAFDEICAEEIALRRAGTG